MPGVDNLLSSLLRILFAALFVTWASGYQVQAAENLHQDWDTLLDTHVYPSSDGHSTVVDYAGFQNDKPRLTRYLDALEQVSQADYDSWPQAHQLAFLINAYNAHTVALILTEYPDLSSIRDLGGFFSSPWEKAIAPLLGETRSLDNIEHTLIRGNYNEPRIHFAVNCASIGCPALRREAYTGPTLNQQLADQTRRFLSDRSRNRLKGDTLEVSRIFSWYGEDFARGWQGLESLPAFLARYADALDLSQKQQQALRNGDIEITFLDYNWDLNDRH